MILKFLLKIIRSNDFKLLNFLRCCLNKEKKIDKIKASYKEDFYIKRNSVGVALGSQSQEVPQ